MTISTESCRRVTLAAMSALVALALIAFRAPAFAQATAGTATAVQGQVQVQRAAATSNLARARRYWSAIGLRPGPAPPRPSRSPIKAGSRFRTPARLRSTSIWRALAAA
jgi:hypothetical protein